MILYRFIVNSLSSTRSAKNEQHEECEENALARRERINRIGNEIETEALSACDAAECARDRAYALCARRDGAHIVLFSLKRQEFVDCHSPPVVSGIDIHEYAERQFMKIDQSYRLE